jgi:hypothetical protein
MQLAAETPLLLTSHEMPRVEPAIGTGAVQQATAMPPGGKG